MALGPEVHVRRVNHPRYNWFATYREGGRIRKKYFSTRKKAETWAGQRQEDALNHGVSTGLTEEERSAVLDLRRDLATLSLPIRKALEFAIDQHRKLQLSVPVSQLIAEFKKEKQDSGASLRYAQDIRSRLGRFERAFGSHSVATIDSISVEQWLRGLKLSPVSQNNFRRLLVGLFNSGKRRKYCDINPAEEVPTTKTVKKPVGILTPTQAKLLLGKADPTIRPVIALGLFAGVRMEELERLDWEHIDREGGYVKIPAEHSKTAKRRLIPIRPNLSRWLEMAPNTSGSVWPSNGRELLRSAKRKAGFGRPDSLTKDEKSVGIELLPWPKNALRHSFASYHVAKFKNTQELALEMGHSDTKLIFQHYRELVHPNEADDFWIINPVNSQKIAKDKTSG